ncbi:MAG: neutral/alkaline non-lysosomal ceramidase N-terminal domain-containing protein [Gemmataceae bacterium]
MADKQLLAGAATSVISPKLGVSLCGSMQERLASNIHDNLHARALVLDNGDTRLAVVVLDLIAARKEWLSQIKHQIHSFTDIPLSNILISCTHTHSAVTPVSVFQSNADTEYLQWARPRVADAVRMAVQRLAPARVGWGVAREERTVFNRRFFMKPGTKLLNPFGGQDRVKMNPGVENPAIDKPAGPTDPEVTVLAVQKADKPAGQPLALFASYALHYVGGNPGGDVSADYFGMVADLLHERTGGPRRDPRQPFVGILANACFGDINNIDVRKRIRQPYEYHQMFAVAELVANAIHDAWRDIRYVDWVPLDVQETSVDLAVRKPTSEEVRQARELLERAPQGPLRTLPDIYARETIQLVDFPDRYQTPVQALRIGDLAICALPGEPFCETGLAIKAKSPFKPTLMVGMANDYAGYLPTEEQHTLGGYETWRAKSSFLEVAAAGKIQDAAMKLLDTLAAGEGR